MATGLRGILGFDYSIVQAPLGPDISGPELAAAVANAGGIGLIRLPDWPAPDHVRELIRKTRSLTRRPFGAAIVLAFPHEENLRVVLEEKVAVLQVYWGEFPRERVEEAHRAGVKVLHQVGSVEEAAKAKEAGVDGIIVQGREAGGHVIGQEGLLPLLPRVVDLVADSGIPVIAAGGIVDGRGYVAALALGAQGVCLGTRFLATAESFAHPLYKQRLVEINCTDYTDIFGRARWPDAPQRVLETPFYSEWKKSLSDHETEENQPIIGHSIIHGVLSRCGLFFLRSGKKISAIYSTLYERATQRKLGFFLKKNGVVQFNNEDAHNRGECFSFQDISSQQLKIGTWATRFELTTLFWRISVFMVIKKHKDIRRFAGTVPNATATGDITSMVMYAGQGVGLITDIMPASEVVKRLVAEARHIMREKLSDYP